jgi:hypothetical protein
VPQQVQRWVEVTRSQFPHEAEGLRLVRSLLPDVAPFRAWSNFEFRDGHGKWHEVDLLVLGRRRLHLVELKYYSGTLRGDDLRWLRDGHRAEDSPLLLARRKAQRLRSKLCDEFARWARARAAGAGPAEGCPVRSGMRLPAPPGPALRASGELAHRPVRPGRRCRPPLRAARHLRTPARAADAAPVHTGQDRPTPRHAAGTHRGGAAPAPRGRAGRPTPHRCSAGPDGTTPSSRWPCA